MATVQPPKPQSKFRPHSSMFDAAPRLSKPASAGLKSHASSEALLRTVPDSAGEKAIVIPASPSPSNWSSSDASYSTGPGRKDSLGPLSPTFSESGSDISLRSPTGSEEHDAYAVDDGWLVSVVLQLYDVQKYDWMTIAEPIQRIWGVRTNSATVLRILQRNQRIHQTTWWD